MRITRDLAARTPGSRVERFARGTLAAIRIVNGAAALFTPAVLANRLGGRSTAAEESLYALRLFGVRTILVGRDLLSADEAVRRHALRVAPLIHGSDVVAASYLARSGQLSRGQGRAVVLISAVNLGLALLARRLAGAGNRRQELDG